MNKTCTKCGGVFLATVEYFHRKKDGKYGLCAECKTCHKKQKREYYHNHHEERLPCVKKYRQSFIGRLRQIYHHIRQRCTDTKAKDYKWYGGRGIKNKFASFKVFYSHITEDLDITTIKQIKGLEIDRTDNNGNYEIGNIRFVTHKVNVNNSRRVKP